MSKLLIEIIKNKVYNFYQTESGICVMDLYDEAEVGKEYSIFKNGASAVLDLSDQTGIPVFGGMYKISIPIDRHETTLKIMNLLSCCMNQINILSKFKWFYTIDVEYDDEADDDYLSIVINAEYTFHCISDTGLEKLVDSLIADLKEILQLRIQPFADALQAGEFLKAVDSVFEQTNRIQISFDPLLMLILQEYSKKTTDNEAETENKVDILDDLINRYFDYVDANEIELIEATEQEMISIMNTLPADSDTKNQVSEFLSLNIPAVHIGYLQAFKKLLNKTEYLSLKKDILKRFPKGFFIEVFEELDERFGITETLIDTDNSLV